MASPFPGMDPYLEGHLWPDVHAALASAIRQALVPLVRPRYAVRLGVCVAEDTAPEAEVGIMYPDVKVLVGMAGPPLGEGGRPAGGANAPVGLPAPLVIPVVEPVEVRLVTVEIRDTAADVLVTAIEILSPINKTGEGLATYRRKRLRLHRAGVHLLEIDLIRRGTRSVAHPRMPPTPYLVTLTRGSATTTDVWPTTTTDVWPTRLEEALPAVPVPLRPPDADVELDLQAVLTNVYETAAHELSIDYKAPPPPALTNEDARWAASLLGWRA